MKVAHLHNLKSNISLCVTGTSRAFLKSSRLLRYVSGKVYGLTPFFVSKLLNLKYSNCHCTTGVTSKFVYSAKFTEHHVNEKFCLKPFNFPYFPHF